MACKIKIADSIAKHDSAEVRFAADFLITAIEKAKSGDLIRMLACIRVAAGYEAAIPTETKLEIYANG